MRKSTLEDITSQISNYLIERGYANSKEEISYNWNRQKNLLEFLGIKEGSINTKNSSIIIKIRRNLPFDNFNIALKNENLTENGSALNLSIDKGKIETIGTSDNLKRLFKIVPASKIYMATNFFEGLYKGFSDSAILFLLFKNLESKNLSALASVTDYMMLDPGEYLGEKLGYKNVDRHLSKHVPNFGVIESFNKWVKFPSSKQWNARKKLENYLFEEHCNKNNEKMQELYLNKVEDLNKIVENSNPESWKDDLINEIIFERKTDIKNKKMYDIIKIDTKKKAFIIDDETKNSFESAVGEIINNPQEFEAKYKPKITKLYEELKKTNLDDIKLSKIINLLFQDKPPRDKKLAPLILALENIDTDNIENSLKRFNREISEKKLRKERGRFSDFVYDFIDGVKKGYIAWGKDSEYLQEADSILTDIKTKKELTKQDTSILNEFLTDYIYNQRVLAQQPFLNDEQKNITNNNIKSASEFVQNYSKDRNADFTATINDIENYLALQKKLMKELKISSEKRYLKLADLEEMLDTKTKHLTRQINNEELEKITENSFKFLNRNRFAEIFSFVSLIGMATASKYTAFDNKLGWGALIGAKSLIDGMITAETNRITEGYFLYSYRKQLEDANVDADLAFTEYSSRCLRYYKRGVVTGLAVGLPFTYAGNNSREWLVLIPASLAVASAAALGVSHYLFQKESRKKKDRTDKTKTLKVQTPS